MIVSPTETPPVVLGLRVLVQLVKLALPIRFLNVYVFSAYKMFTTFRAPFFNRISHFKIVAMP